MITTLSGQSKAEIMKTLSDKDVNIGKELLDILSSQQDIDIKKESIRNFQKIVEISFEHPMMRETYLRQKDEFLMIRDIEHIIMGVISSLENDIN